MSQNINLLTTLPSYPKTGFTPKTLLQLFLCWLALLIVIYFFAVGVSIHRQSKLQNLQQKEKALLEQIDNTGKTIATYKSIALRGAITTALGQNATVERAKAGFYEYLNDLAEFTPPGIWLQSIIIDNSSGDISLQGSAYSAALVANFLQKLDKSDIYPGKKFGTLKLKKSDTENIVSFTLGTPIVREAKKEIETKK
jgi:Tfp pilus assembly protein PilN